jgi:hypothetical protein
MLALTLLTCLLCFLSPNPTHASRLIIQLVSDCRVARHVVHVICPRWSDVSSGYRKQVRHRPLSKMQAEDSKWLGADGSKLAMKNETLAMKINQCSTQTI